MIVRRREPRFQKTKQDLTNKKNNRETRIKVKRLKEDEFLEGFTQNEVPSCECVVLNLRHWR